MKKGENISIHCLPVGDLATNCYIISRGGGPSLLIDPGAEGERIASELHRLNLTPEVILLTHSHYDHIGGAQDLQAVFRKAEVACHPDCAARAENGRANFSFFLIGRAQAGPRVGRALRDGETVSAGGLSLTAYETPGHAPGHMIFALAEANAIFCGDLVFAGSIGRVDIPEADASLLAASIRRLFGNFAPETVIWPGHGNSSTLAREAQNNPWVREILA